jgi:phospholipid transport system substrate-binding protein
MIAQYLRSSVLALAALCASLLLVLPVADAMANATAVVDTSGPAQLIQTASDAMLKDIDVNRAKYHQDKAGLYKLVDTVLLPNFDVNYAAQQVLGKHWREADEMQRARFVKAFYRSLLETYGDALVDFTGDRIKFLPFVGDPAAPRATVRTEIRRDGGSIVTVNYSLRKTEAGWKAWDVVIEGISYVKSFQEDFGPEVEQKGLESLILRLESPGVAVKPSHHG